jgi:hypothetical protein
MRIASAWKRALRDETGTVLVIAALGLTALLGFAAMAIVIGVLFYTRRRKLRPTLLSKSKFASTPESAKSIVDHCSLLHEPICTRLDRLTMQIELDHIFVCADPGAPEAEEFIRFGLREGEPNTHPGQGTASRRFPFADSMIELMWVSDAAEAQSPLTRRTLLWERWSNRASGASPFGICLRPVTDQTAANGANVDTPFPGWAYKPSYLPEPLAFHIGEAPTEEPMWVYLSFMLRSQRATYFTENRAGLCQITGLMLHTLTSLESEASRIVVGNGILSACVAERPLLEIEFDRRRRDRHKDFRPLLPIIFHF